MTVSSSSPPPEVRGDEVAERAWSHRFRPDALAAEMAGVPDGPVLLALQARLAIGEGRLDECLPLCEEALAGLDDEPLWQARVLEVRGNTYKEIGLLADARSSLEQAWRLYDDVGDVSGRATVRQNTAALDFLAPQAVVELFEEALALAQESGDGNVEGLVRMNLSIAGRLVGRGDDHRREHLTRAERLLEHEWPDMAVRVRCLRLDDELEAGRVDAAQALAALLPAPADHPDRITRGDIALALADLAIAQGRPDDAVEVLQQTVAAEPDGSVPRGVRHGLAQALRAAGRFEDALDESDRALAELEQRLVDDRAADLRALDAVYRTAMLREERRREQERADELQQALHELQEAHERISRLSSHDVVTGLRNRLHLMEQAPRLLQRATPETPGEIALIDLDHFKRVNDTFGHPQGDQVLMAFADVLRATLRPDDLVARYGGEEFVVVRPPWGDGPGLVEDLERVRGVLATGPWVDTGGRPLPRITLSAGVVTVAGQPLERALGEADVRMYAAKRAGRDRIESCPASRPPG